MKLTWAILIALLGFAVIAFAQRPTRNISVGDSVSVLVPPGWQIANRSRDSLEIYLPSSAREQPEGDRRGNPKPEYIPPPDAGMLITIERRKDHLDALKRLAEISVEYPERAVPLVIAGWPAIERTYRDYMPQPGESDGQPGELRATFTTTAVAVGNLLVRFNTMYGPHANLAAREAAFAVARNMNVPRGNAAVSQRELSMIGQLAPRPVNPRQSPDRQQNGPRGNKPAKGVPIQVQTGVGELEVATNDGQHVVVAANSGFSFSDNAGGTYTSGGGTPCNQVRCDGDPSLAAGASGAIYYSWIGGPTTTQLGDGVSRSTDNGHTFPFQAMAVSCPGTTSCSTADQEHIAADRFNTAAGGGDFVYVVWRNFLTSGGLGSIRIACSSNNGSTWGTSIAVGAGDFPRVAVGRDGFVYVAWVSGGNMMLHKYSNCDSGLVAQTGWPVTVAAFSNVVCPVAGLDRCNGRNTLSSPVVVGDDLQADHLYYAFASSSGAGNENIVIMDSSDGGATFPRSVTANSSVTARRYLSWVSAYGGMAVVSWYDRRNATTANNDLARYFIGGAAVRGPSLVALTETDLSGANDNQCSLWPWPTNATTDSESCSVQPQLAGYCAIPTATSPPAGYTPCDFSSPACPTGQVCKFDRGAPKYGDYNGNAAGAGRMFSAWASSVPPAGVAGTAGTLRVYSSLDRIPSDFYVRDWNAGATFDSGQQPSTHADFWSSSSLWNQNTNTALAPGPSGWVPGDPPDRGGSNFLFATINRRAAAATTAPAALVTANFFFADFGLGTTYSSLGSENVTFAAADLAQTTAGLSWTVPASASGHLCTSVQIAGPDGDVSAFPSLTGSSPGTGVIADNNIAQRNLQETVGTAGGGTEIIGMVRNWLPEQRNMRLRVMVPPGVQLDAMLELISARGTAAEPIRLGRETAINTGILKPGEVRWLRFHANNLKGLAKPAPILVFDETMPRGGGFTILLHEDRPERVIARSLAAFRNVLLRIAKIEGNRDAAKIAALAAASARTPSGAAYLDFLKRTQKPVDLLVNSHLQKMGGSDAFRIRAATADLWSALAARDIDRATAAQIAMTERLDAHLTSTFYPGGIRAVR